ncbi:hypothetical protein IMZ48_33335 [Candidatus Bathyarchaeota archaeon]|nr:hypothetical protein [Candidatus Bathyarchaeota archaeon]
MSLTQFANVDCFSDPNGSPGSEPEMLPVDEAPLQLVPAPQTANVVRRKLTGYVGFANLPNQWHRKSVRKGFNFNVMVVGKFTSPFLPALGSECSQV